MKSPLVRCSTLAASSRATWICCVNKLRRRPARQKLTTSSSSNRFPINSRSLKSRSSSYTTAHELAQWGRILFSDESLVCLHDNDGRRIYRRLGERFAPCCFVFRSMSEFFRRFLHLVGRHLVRSQNGSGYRCWTGQWAC